MANEGLQGSPTKTAKNPGGDYCREGGKAKVYSSGVSFKVFVKPMFYKFFGGIDKYGSSKTVGRLDVLLFVLHSK